MSALSPSGDGLLALLVLSSSSERGSRLRCFQRTTLHALSETTSTPRRSARSRSTSNLGSTYSSTENLADADEPDSGAYVRTRDGGRKSRLQRQTRARTFITQPARTPSVHTHLNVDGVDAERGLGSRGQHDLNGACQVGIADRMP